MSTKIGPDEDAWLRENDQTHQPDWVPTFFFLPCALIFNFKFNFKFGICLAKGVKFGLLVRSLLEQNKVRALKPSLI